MTRAKASLRSKSDRSDNPNLMHRPKLRPQTEIRTSTKPDTANINTAVDTDSFRQPESPQIQNQPDDIAEPREKPPIEIKEIQPTDSHAPAEFPQTTTEPNQPYS